MPKILVFAEDKLIINNVVSPLKNLTYVVSAVEQFDLLYEEATKFSPDIIILSINNKLDEVSRICRKLRLLDQRSDVQIILLVNENVELKDISQGADAYIQYPINLGVLISTVNAHLRLKNHLDIFSTNNNELAQRFYQLKVKYDTNSKLAGTLNPRKLINVMMEGLEQSISYSLSSTLLINSPSDILLIINSLYPITKRLENALKTRALMNYKSLFTDGKIPIDFTINDIKTEINFKNEEKIYDFESLRFASIFSPISTQDSFFGTVEIMRDTELSTEDTTCFQTVVSQVALPLESAKLYEEIREKNSKLEKLEKLKSEFISIVSHELRTPLTAIKNALDIILLGKTGDINSTMSKFLNMGKANVDRLSVIINDLLDLSKIEAGKMDFRFEKVNLSDPIHFVVSTFEPNAIKKNIQLKTNIKVDNTFAYADSAKIEQVLKNLVSNALKFTNEKGKITITLSEDKKNINNWLVQVKDTGIGISEENLSKVFDKFQQIESSLIRKVGGTGLGLPISKEFITSHNGKIWVESQEGKGSTFAFTLPKYDEYSNFLTEFSLFYEKAKNANTNFFIAKIYADNNFESINDYIAKDNKCRKIFIKNNNIYIISQTLNRNLYLNYLEKLQDFISKLKNDNILLKMVYCDFKENKTINELIKDFEL